MAISIGVTTPASAELKFCNETSANRSVAVAFSEDKRWQSEGWWIVKPGECKTVVSGDLRQRYYYYRATAPGRTFAGQNYFFCTQKKPFTILGQKQCSERGYDRAEFRKLDTGKAAKNFTLTLTKSATKTPKPVKPGTYGEPATVSGTFVGCKTETDPDYCEIRGQEWIYVVAKDKRTPRHLYSALQALTIGQNVTIEGDLVGYGDISADIVARIVTAGSKPSNDTNRHARIRGGWRSLDDKQSQIRFENGAYYSYYNGDLIERGRYSFNHSCDGAEGDFLKVNIDGDSDPYCYGIEQTGDRLDLVYLPRGNTLSYERAAP